MLCVVCYTSKVLHNIDKGDRGCLHIKFCIKWASMYMVIRNEVKVMLFRLSAARIFDQDCRIIKQYMGNKIGWFLLCILSYFCDVQDRTWKLYFRVAKSSKTTWQTGSWRYPPRPNYDIHLVFEVASSLVNLSILSLIKSILHLELNYMETIFTSFKY
jgi:hypothetical protein